MKFPQKRQSKFHYERLVQERNQRLRETFQQRFWAKIKRGQRNACWRWKGHTTKGYGVFSNRCGYYGVTKRGYLAAHRIAWELANGPIPAGMYVCHKCDCRPCCNPRHLFVGTHTDNMIDRQIKGRTASGNRVKWFGMFGTRSIAHKLTESKVAKIRKRYAKGGVTYRQLGKQFGVSKALIGAIVRREIWPHVE